MVLGGQPTLHTQEWTGHEQGGGAWGLVCTGGKYKNVINNCLYGIYIAIVYTHTQRAQNLMCMQGGVPCV